MNVDCEYSVKDKSFQIKVIVIKLLESSHWLDSFEWVQDARLGKAQTLILQALDLLGDILDENE